MGAVAGRLVGRDVDSLVEDPAAVNRELAWDSQLRWLGPDKGVMGMAIGAVMTAVWDLRARREGRPLWSALARLEPAEIVDLVDWTYIADFCDPGRAREILEEQRPQRDTRIAELWRDGLAAYATTPGWLGYSDEKLVRLCHEAVADGFTTVKLKVGADTGDDRRRLGLAREAVGPEVAIAVDANQRWSVPEAIAAINELREFDLRWVEEPPRTPTTWWATPPSPRPCTPSRSPPARCSRAPLSPSNSCSSAASGSCRSTPPAWAGRTTCWPPSSWRRRPGWRSSLTPAASACARPSSTTPSSTPSAWPPTPGAYPSSTSTTYTSTLTDPVEVSNGRYQLPSRPGASTAFHPGTEQTFAYPTGTEWAR